MRTYLISLLLLLTSSITLADETNLATPPSTQHILWNKTPISITVPVGEERLISFPEAIRINNADPNLTTDKIRLLNNNGTLYITANKAFKPVRLTVQLQRTGTAIFIDLSADKEAADNPLSIVLPAKPNQSLLPTQSNRINDVSLTRFAIAQLYPSLRLTQLVTGVDRLPMHTSKMVNLFYAQTLLAFPLASWQGGRSYITAIELANTLDKPVALDPRHIIGNWQAAVFFPRNQLGKKGSSTSHTTCFLISQSPFQDALKQQSILIRGQG